MGAATDRFRQQLMDAKHEYSAYIDSAGYVHALASTGDEGSTKVAPLSALAHEKGVSAVIHNHPSGGSDGRKWGGPFSGDDLVYLAKTNALSGGKINKIIATAKEGTYTATVKKRVSTAQASRAAAKADASLAGKKYPSELSMWGAVNSAYTSEFAKIGIDIKFERQRKRKSRLVTQKTGTY